MNNQVVSEDLRKKVLPLITIKGHRVLSGGQGPHVLEVFNLDLLLKNRVFADLTVLLIESLARPIEEFVRKTGQNGCFITYEPRANLIAQLIAEHLRRNFSLDAKLRPPFYLQGFQRKWPVVVVGHCRTTGAALQGTLKMIDIKPKEKILIVNALARSSQSLSHPEIIGIDCSFAGYWAPNDCPFCNPER